MHNTPQTETSVVPSMSKFRAEDTRSSQAFQDQYLRRAGSKINPTDPTSFIPPQTQHTVPFSQPGQSLPHFSTGGQSDTSLHQQRPYAGQSGTSSQTMTTLPYPVLFNTSTSTQVANTGDAGARPKTSHPDIKLVRNKRVQCLIF